MKLDKKHLILLIIVGMVVSSIPAITLCSSYCVSSDLDIDPPVDGSCPFSFHSFAQIVFMLSVFGVLPFAGLFSVRIRHFIPSEVYWPLLKPPRFSY